MTALTAPYPDELDALLDALCDDQISDEQFGRLETFIRDEPAARRRYIATMELVVDLEWGDADPRDLPGMSDAHGRHLAQLIQTAATEESVFDSVDADALSVEQRPSVLRSAATLAESIHWQLHPIRFLAAAGILTLLFWLGFFGWVATNQQQTAQNSNDALKVEVVASLRVSPDCCWSKEAKRPADFGHLLTGQRLAVDAGLLEITYGSGARVVLEGPVEYTVTERNMGFLEHGRLVAQVPATANGFTVQTPGAKVTDLGTCFGLLVDKLGATEVHVFEGRVEVAQLASQTTGTKPTQLAKGQAVRYAAPGEPSLCLPLDDALANLRLKAIVPRDTTMAIFQDGRPIPKQAGGDGTSVYEGTRDMHLREADGGLYNTGAEPNLALGQYADNEEDNTRILIDFDCGSLAQCLATNNLRIASVTLKLYHAGIAGNSPATGQTVDIFPAISNFNEGAKASNGRDGHEASIDESTWGSQAFPTRPWAGGGHHSEADFVPSHPLDTLTLGDATVRTWRTFDVTAAFAPDGSDLADHAGLVLLSRVDNANPNAERDRSGGKQMLFSSSEANQCRPMLIFQLQEKTATTSSKN